MSDSWFGNRDIDDIPDDPNSLPNNTYVFQVTGAKLGPTKDKSKNGITFRYQIIEGAWSTFFPITDWVQVPDDSVKAEEVDRMLSSIKMRLLAFGFPPEKIQKFGPKMVESCIGRKFFGTTNIRKDKNDQNQIRVQRFDPYNPSADYTDDDIVF